MNKLVFCLLFSLGFSAVVNASGGYFRHPSLYQDTLVFTAEGDIWRMQLGQSVATRLTTHPSLEHSAVFSPDGQHIAFVANYEGTSEVHVMPIIGGVAKRVTFENSTVKLHQWHKDGIVFSTNSRVGPTGSWVLKTVQPDSLTTTTIPLSDAVEGRLDSDGEMLFFTQFGLQMSNDNANQYQGGASGELWRYELNSKQEATALTAAHSGSVREPMVANDRVYFVSNQSGLDNIWSMSKNGSEQQQITQFDDWAVRNAMLNEGRIVFQQGADLKMLNVANNHVSTIDIQLTSDFADLRDHWVSKPLTYFNSARFTGEKAKVTITARGRVAVAGTDSQRLVQIATDPSSRTRNAVLSHDGKWVYAINDVSGEAEIWQYAADGSVNAKRLTNDGNVFRWNLYPSPDGEWLAHDDKQGNLWLLNLEDGANRQVISNNSGISPLASLRWSHDSSHLAVTHNRVGSERSQVLLYSVNEDKHEVLTSEKYESFSPTFSPDGKWLYFLSNRHFRATPGAPWGDRNMGPIFDRRTQIFALSLDASASFPFQDVTELKNEKEKETKLEDESTEAEESASTSMQVDWQGLTQRLWQVPGNSGNFSNLSMNEGFLYVVDRVNEPNQQPKLLSIEVKPQGKYQTFTTNIADYQLSADGKSMFVRKSGADNTNQFIVKAGAKFPKDVSKAKLQTAQWKLLISPRDEWLQIFRDTWLMHRDSLFDANMRGLDWPATKAKYQPLLARVTDRHELNDIFEQMMGELNTLHSQVRGGDFSRDTDAPRAASLGATYHETKNGLHIAHIYRHDPELPNSAAPLAQPGVDAQVGDVITALNGLAINNQAGLVNALRNQIGQQVRLDLLRNGEPISTIVKPVNIFREFRLRYNDWVAGNAQKVTEQNEQLGYLHLYAMGGNDIATFAREFYAQYQQPGLIIDVRRNRGGNVDAWVLEKLLKRTWMFWQTSNGEQSTNMQQTFRGHLVVLADEFTYSDGETFTAGIKALELGTVIGKQTAGAGVWLSGRNRVVDGGIARVAEYPVFATDGRWIVEGVGVKPDIEISNLPHATFNGEDAQLDAAIRYLEEKLKAQPIPKLDAKPLPDSAAPAEFLKQ